MNNLTPAAFVPELMRDLRSFVVVCEDLLALSSREHQALTSLAEYQSFDFFRGRKDLLTRLDQSLINIRQRRQTWQQCNPAERARHSEVKALFQMLQDLIIRILQLDRENQQSLLRRGLLPAREVPSFAGQQPHYVAGLYRRHSSP